MRLLVIFCHPSSLSFGAALYALACRTLRATGHDLRTHDLYREGLNPVLSTEEWAQYPTHPERNQATQEDHIADLRWAELFDGIPLDLGPEAFLSFYITRKISFSIHHPAEVRVFANEIMRGAAIGQDRVRLPYGLQRGLKNGLPPD
jgi:Flavodoxin-like fold/YcdC-like protein, C-terminal region